MMRLARTVVVIAAVPCIMLAAVAGIMISAVLAAFDLVTLIWEDRR